MVATTAALSSFSDGFWASGEAGHGLSKWGFSGYECGVPRRSWIFKSVNNIGKADRTLTIDCLRHLQAPSLSCIWVLASLMMLNWDKKACHKKKAWALNKSELVSVQPKANTYGMDLDVALMAKGQPSESELSATITDLADFLLGLRNIVDWCTREMRYHAPSRQHFRTVEE